MNEIHFILLRFASKILINSDQGGGDKRGPMPAYSFVLIAVPGYSVKMLSINRLLKIPV